MSKRCLVDGIWMNLEDVVKPQIPVKQEQVPKLPETLSAANTPDQIVVMPPASENAGDLDSVKAPPAPVEVKVVEKRKSGRPKKTAGAVL